MIPHPHTHTETRPALSDLLHRVEQLLAGRFTSKAQLELALTDVVAERMQLARRLRLARSVEPIIGAPAAETSPLVAELTGLGELIERLRDALGWGP